MPYTIKDYRRQIAREVLQEMTPKDRLEFVQSTFPRTTPAVLSAEQRLATCPSSPAATATSIAMKT
jgi:hypothetical protein